jgi:threonine synthase
MFNCPHTGVGLAALRKLVEKKIIRSQDRVVVISTANGLKFADQKAAYHMGALHGIKPTYRNKPVELPADAKRVARAIARHVEKAKLLVS